ncbi:MAG TPA: YihY/virulence factor BrkB family protein [Solirubrobacterales bacterium]|nr:YihY/virulence factor BrkB family protein [Solirubrobacterales bacterium]
MLKRTVSEFRADNLTDWAAALTYYAVLSIFPALIVLVSILGLAGDSATNAVLDNINELGPGPAQDIISGAIEQIAASQGTAGVAFVLGLVAALWSASGYVGAFSRASNVIYETEEGRPFWKLRPLQIGMTLVLLLLVALSAIAVVISGPLTSEVGKLFGVEGTAVTVFNIVKWPVIVVVVITMLAILYYGAPNVRHPGFRWITPGGILAVLLWILASAGFALYVANFASYNETYGSLAGVIVFLVWLWISNVAVLLGAEMNAELERGRELESGVPEERTIAMEPRSPASNEPREA